MVHDCNTRGKKQELVKMNRYSQMKEMENIILSINSLKDEILNLKVIVIKISKMRMKNFDKNVSDLRDVVQSMSLTIMLWLSMVV